MRHLLLAATLAVAQPALGQEVVSSDAAGATSLSINTSFSINAPMVASDPEGIAAEDKAYREEMYRRSVTECDILLASLAKSCSIVSVSVTTQVNRNPASPISCMPLPMS
ncbi:MAG: hypothetical protein HC844_14665 [Tabrizicola sp.]|nr:hypothetical protein [Tabrizicola sp.]